MFKRLLSLLFAMCLVLTVAPVSVFAEDGGGTVTISGTVLDVEGTLLGDASVEVTQDDEPVQTSTTDATGAREYTYQLQEGDAPEVVPVLVRGTIRSTEPADAPLELEGVTIRFTPDKGPSVETIAQGGGEGTTTADYNMVPLATTPATVPLP